MGLMSSDLDMFYHVLEKHSNRTCFSSSKTCRYERKPWSGNDSLP